MSSKPCISSLVVVPLFISFVHPTVTLNCESDFATKEINDVVTELVLTPEF